MTHRELKDRHRRERESYHASLNLRVHRALSWLGRAEQCGDDLDARFIFLWIAFNATYASRLSADGSASENREFNRFLARLLQFDTERLVENMLWQKYSGPIRLLLENPFVFPAFWKAQSGELSDEEWKQQFRRARRKAQQALAQQATLTLLGILLPRIYMLRNQLVHGGATWQSSANRTQVSDCTALMSELVPLVIRLMMDNPRAEWPPAAFPVVERVR
ncbi:MAG: hypothetical protein ACO280_10930 [Pseudohongiellaceae bacterium]|jgi:hypothetical protein